MEDLIVPRRWTRQIGRLLVVCVGLMLWVNCVDAAPVYNIVNLGTLPGTRQSIATGINAQGQVVGISYNTHDLLNGYDAGAQSFLYSAGRMTQISPIGGLANAINDSGQAVGGLYYDINNAGQYIGYGQLYSGGNQTNLGRWSDALVINGSGVVAGAIVIPTTGGFIDHAGAYSNGNWSDLNQNLPVNQSSIVIGINNKGDLLITSTSGNVSQSFLVANGKYTDLTTLAGGSGKTAAGLNDLNQTVGNNFLYSSGQFYTLTDLIPKSSGWTQLEATRINDAGQIIGQGEINGQEHAFLMTPLAQTVPEPTSIVIFGGLTVSLGLFRILKRRS